MRKMGSKSHKTISAKMSDSAIKQGNTSDLKVYQGF